MRVCIYASAGVWVRVVVAARHLEGHPPVEDAQLTICRAEQVAGVRVTVQGARVEEHRQVRVDGDPAQPRHVLRAGGRKALPFDPLGGQHVR